MARSVHKICKSVLIMPVVEVAARPTDQLAGQLLPAELGHADPSNCQQPPGFPHGEAYVWVKGMYRNSQNTRSVQTAKCPSLEQCLHRFEAITQKALRAHVSSNRRCSGPLSYFGEIRQGAQNSQMQSSHLCSKELTRIQGSESH